MAAIMAICKARIEQRLLECGSDDGESRIKLLYLQLRLDASVTRTQKEATTLLFSRSVHLYFRLVHQYVCMVRRSSAHRRAPNQGRRLSSSPHRVESATQGAAVGRVGFPRCERRPIGASPTVRARPPDPFTNSLQVRIRS